MLLMTLTIVAVALSICLTAMNVWLLNEARKERTWLIRAVMARHLGSLTTAEVVAKTKRPTTEDHEDFNRAHREKRLEYAPPLMREQEKALEELERQGQAIETGFEDPDSIPDAV